MFRFYVGCDRCQDWFHCECVGITQEEADALDSYICPNCQKKDQEDPINQKELNDRDYDLLFKLVRSLQVWALLLLLIFQPPVLFGHVNIAYLL